MSCTLSWQLNSLIFYLDRNHGQQQSNPLQSLICLPLPAYPNESQCAPQELFPWQQRVLDHSLSAWKSPIFLSLLVEVQTYKALSTPSYPCQKPAECRPSSSPGFCKVLGSSEAPLLFLEQACTSRTSHMKWQDTGERWPHRKLGQGTLGPDPAPV